MILVHTVNPQTVVRLSFPTLVFLVRLSFEVFRKLSRQGKSFLRQTKDQKRPEIKNWSCCYAPGPIRNQLELGATIF